MLQVSPIPGVALFQLNCRRRHAFLPRPLEARRPVVDLNTMKGLRVEDYGRIPRPTTNCNTRADRVEGLRTDLKPWVITPPEGPSIKVCSHQVWAIPIFRGRKTVRSHRLPRAASCPGPLGSLIFTRQ
jgi:Cu2+-containing amine oxidase